jgi:hypothetical protein
MSAEWTSGYVKDVDYTYGYYHEMNPLHMQLALLNKGIAIPNIGSACELGFGQGLSVNIHGAGMSAVWHGTDFNPSQTGFANELANVSGADVSLSDGAFSEFCNDPSLPNFDYICLHGIWSWISDENRQVIVDFARKKLNVGGVLYISYNTLPGWANFAPMRHLMTQHAEIVGSEDSGIVSRIDGAIKFAQDLLKTKPIYSGANPQVIERMSHLKNQNRHYLAHEYFNKDWHPMYFSDMAEWLESAKLSFACSAHYMEHIDSVNLTKDQAELMATIKDPDLTQSVRDFMVNQQFRRDYWIKGKRNLTDLERVEALQKITVILAKPRSEFKMKAEGPLGEAQLAEEIYVPILNELESHQPRSISQLQDALKDTGMNFGQLVQAVMVLAGDGTVLPINPPEVIEQARDRTSRLNDHLIQKARSSGQINVLSSPVSGSGIPLGRFHQLFIGAIKQGYTDHKEWAQSVMDILKLQGQSIIKDGKTLESEEENLAELIDRAKEFEDNWLPIVRALGVAP